MTEPDRPYTQEMVVVHRVFRSQADLLPQLVRAVPDGDRGRAEEVAARVTTYVSGLHHHHTAEDELIWPLLAERVRPGADLVRLMQEQHETIDQSLTQVDLTLAAWRHSVEPGTRDHLLLAFDAHRTALVAHLDAEEEHILPMVRKHLTVAEWDAVGARAVGLIPPAQRLLGLCAVLDHASTEERDHFLGKLPVAARIVLRLVGQRRYARERQRIQSLLATG
ncbi:hemerythrin domain-containing protein [Micromonospora sp. WMMD1082]|uniref:hemerythrin domain-containing protein n=1 Tax=Micromonospora sp. WMMD1082 TaxID=3016104 RepID=UPI002417098F|nr:hemerythrin domain-containing protein [Micromonospora sp. WMMD1082]MDG4793001.1 hemerythrin domain-containing protein [Micromonospora sp. WMMD1082]